LAGSRRLEAMYRAAQLVREGRAEEALRELVAAGVPEEEARRAVERLASSKEEEDLERASRGIERELGGLAPGEVVTTVYVYTPAASVLLAAAAQVLGGFQRGRELVDRVFWAMLRAGADIRILFAPPRGVSSVRQYYGEALEAVYPFLREVAGEAAEEVARLYREYAKEERPYRVYDRPRDLPKFPPKRW